MMANSEGPSEPVAGRSGPWSVQVTDTVTGGVVTVTGAPVAGGATSEATSEATTVVVVVGAPAVDVVGCGMTGPAIVVVVFGLLDFRLFWLQVINRPDFTRMAASNRIRIETIEPLRGRILDRNGNLLVENRPSYTLYAQPWIIRKQQGSVVNLAGILQLEPDELRQRISRRGWYTFAPSVLQRDLSWDALAALEAQLIDFPGILFRLESKRRYLCPVAVHILGYIGERDIANPQSGGIRYNLVGKRGLEKTYEKYLGGEPGVKYLEVDANGRLIGEASDKPSIPSQPGWDLYLNIDAKLQDYACELMADRTGAIVAMDPRDGAVLVLVSEPDYDPSLFTGVMPQEVWDELTSDPAKPLLNRAIQGLYPPGSTFKMVGLCAGYSEGVIGENFGVHCPGGLQIGNRWFNCWKHSGHGEVGPIDGLQHSCDVFFYTVGLRLGIERMEKYARELGMGLEEIAAAVGKLEPAPHRLQMSRTQAGVTILDDSYNSNPAGAAEAFRVLSEFQGGQRVLVTPGLVELGALQEQENEKFGRLAARAADCVILVGPEQTRPVARGLKAEGFPPEHTHVVKSLSDATALLGRLLRSGDTVLFENDLPDLYTER